MLRHSSPRLVRGPEKEDASSGDFSAKYEKLP